MDLRLKEECTWTYTPDAGIVLFVNIFRFVTLMHVDLTTVMQGAVCCVCAWKQAVTLHVLD